MANQISDLVQGQGQHWIFLHGWGLHKGIWEPILDKLSPHIHIRCIDLPGFGSSDWSEALVDFEKAVEEVERHIQSVESGPVSLLGWSLGGLFAIELARRAQLDIQGLALVASSPKFIADQEWPGIKENVLTVFQKQLHQDYEATIERFLAVQAMGSPLMKREIRQMHKLITGAPTPQEGALLAGLDWLLRIDLSDAFANLTLPTLRMYGRFDSLVPAAQADFFQNPKDTTTIFEHSAHTPFFSEPENFTESLLAYNQSLISD